jgi:hypothetical protein
MRIDAETESTVRQVLRAVDRRDEGQLAATLKRLSGDRQRLAGVLNLVLQILTLAVIDIFKAEPAEQHLQALAVKLTALDQWWGPPAEDVEALLRGVFLGESTPGSSTPGDSREAMVHCFVITGLLLGARQAQDGQGWDAYLDRIEADIRTMPEISVG